MRRAVDQNDHAATATADRAAFFQLVGNNVADRQTLLRRLVDIATKKTQWKLSARQPIGSLRPIAEERNLGFLVELAHEFGADGLPVIKNQHRAWMRRAARVHAEKLAIPLGCEHIPIGLDFFRVYHLGVV